MIVRPIAPPTLLLALALAGCAGEDPGGRVVVGLTTDMAVGFDIDHLEATAAVDGAVATTESLSYGAGDLSLPSELLLPPAPDGARVALSLQAFRDGEPSPVVTRTATTLAADGRMLLLPVSLDEACAGVTCDAGATCAQGACTNPFMAPSALPDHDPTWLDSAPDACKTPYSGEPALVIGAGQSAYSAIEDGAVVPIEPGPQGGHHVWLALRVTGLRQMGTRVTVRGTYPDLGFDLHPPTFGVTLRKAADDQCEIYGIRFQVDYQIPVDTIRGQTLDIAFALEDPTGDTAAATRRVVIAP